jgi:uncharacterized cupin superfamily protein
MSASLCHCIWRQKKKTDKKSTPKGGREEEMCRTKWNQSGRLHQSVSHWSSSSGEMNTQINNYESCAIIDIWTGYKENTGKAFNFLGGSQSKLQERGWCCADAEFDLEGPLWDFMYWATRQGTAPPLPATSSLITCARLSPKHIFLNISIYYLLPKVVCLGFAFPSSTLTCLKNLGLTLLSSLVF